MASSSFSLALCLSQEKLLKRRAKNRESAKKSRDKKNDQWGVLNEQVRQTTERNQQLQQQWCARNGCPLLVFEFTSTVVQSRLVCNPEYMATKILLEAASNERVLLLLVLVLVQQVRVDGVAL